MALFPYNRDIPFGAHNPSIDQPDMLENTNSTDSLIDVDHVSFGLNNGGYHKIIHQTNPVAAPRSRTTVAGNDTFTNFPAGIAGINQVFSASYTPDAAGAVADTQLFNTTGNGNALGVGVSQLTGALIGASNDSDGWQWIGNVLIQWGRVSFSGTSQQQGTVTFQNRVPLAIPFPNFCYVVNTTLHDAGGANTANTQNVSVFTLTKSTFKWNYTGSSAYDRFYWIAIGS